jgi:hypothetical protein
MASTPPGWSLFASSANVNMRSTNVCALSSLACLYFRNSIKACWLSVFSANLESIPLLNSPKLCLYSYTNIVAKNNWHSQCLFEKLYILLYLGQHHSKEHIFLCLFIHSLNSEGTPLNGGIIWAIPWLFIVYDKPVICWAKLLKAVPISWLAIFKYTKLNWKWLTCVFSDRSWQSVSHAKSMYCWQLKLHLRTLDFKSIHSPAVYNKLRNSTNVLYFFDRWVGTVFNQCLFFIH